MSCSRTTKFSNAATAAILDEPNPQGLPDSANALAAEANPEVPQIDDEDRAELTMNDLFDPAATGRVIVVWDLTPSVAAVASFALFQFVLL